MLKISSSCFEEIKRIAVEYSKSELHLSDSVSLFKFLVKQKPNGAFVKNKLRELSEIIQNKQYVDDINDYLSIDERVDCYFPDFSERAVLNYKNRLASCGYSVDYVFDKVIKYKKNVYSDRGGLGGSYRKDMDNFLSLANNTLIQDVLVIFGDKQLTEEIPVFCKTRTINSPKNGIILKLNSERHWHYLDSLLHDIEWEMKVNDVVWRGVPTGSKSLSRVKFVKKYKGSYNIAFSKRGVYKGDLDDDDILDYVSIPEQLKYKYIVSIEGNDVATNLKWILESNSVPLMPHPKSESWLLESKLIPYIHYIPLSDNLDNLDEVLIWCARNDQICKQIAQNGKFYMRMFSDKRREDEIYMKIISKFSNLII